MLFNKKIKLTMTVVYFDQPMGALHTAGWLKSRVDMINNLSKPVFRIRMIYFSS